MPLTDKSYATLAEADEFWGDRYDTEWAGLTDPQKSAALIRATEWIDRKFNFNGYITDPDQRLKWPRKKAIDSEGRLREGIPQEVKEATSWLAKYSVDGEIEVPKQRGGDIKSVKAGSVEVEWSELAPVGTTYDYVRDLLRDLIGGLKMRKA